MGICELLADDITLHPSHRNLISKAVRTADVLLDLVGLVLDMGAVEGDQLPPDRKTLAWLTRSSKLES